MCLKDQSRWILVLREFYLGYRWWTWLLSNYLVYLIVSRWKGSCSAAATHSLQFSHLTQTNKATTSYSSTVSGFCAVSQGRFKASTNQAEKTYDTSQTLQTNPSSLQQPRIPQFPSTLRRAILRSLQSKSSLEFSTLVLFVFNLCHSSVFSAWTFSI